MPDNYLENQVLGEIKPLKKKPKWWVIVIDVILLVIFLAVLAVSSNVVYLSAKYGEPFYVSGASMYPTLNSKGFRYNKSTDSYTPLTWNIGDNGDGDIVDYGWAKSKEKGNWKADLHRYDIVIAYYPSDYTDKTYSTLNASASLKIKRLIAFPGETIKFENDPSYNPVWGKTTITHEDGTSEVLPNLYTLDDFPDLPDGTKYYIEGRSTVTKTTIETKLKEDEYFVMGDNRIGAHSDDSRNVGPLKDNMIQGKAYVLTGMRKLAYVQKEDGTIVKEPKFLLNKIRMPWDYISLEYKA